MTTYNDDLSYEIIKKSNLDKYLDIDNISIIISKIFKDEEDIESFRLANAIFRIIKNINSSNETTYQILKKIDNKLKLLIKRNSRIGHEVKKYINKSFTVYQNNQYDRNFKHIGKNIFGGPSLSNNKVNSFFQAYFASKSLNLEMEENEENKVLLKNIKQYSYENVGINFDIDFNSNIDIMNIIRKKLSNVEFNLDSIDFETSYLNKDIKNPSKVSPNLSVFLIKNNLMSPINKQNFELSTFFNMLTTQELSRAIPYINIEFSLPRFSARDNKVIKSGTFSQFINGKLSGDFDKIISKRVNSSRLNPFTRNIDLVKTNSSIYTAPQTMVNMNEEVGHYNNRSNSSKKLRITSVHDATRPFISIDTLNIDVAPTKGLLNYKTAKLSLILHDRTRLNEIASLIKPELFGQATDIDVEYGWSHPDQITSKTELNKTIKNPIGAFIGSSKLREKYSIVNSSFTIQNDSSVKIDLSLATKGAINFKEKEIKSNIQSRLNYNHIKTLIKDINSKIDTYNAIIDDNKKNKKIIIKIGSETKNLECLKINNLIELPESIFDKNQKITEDDEKIILKNYNINNVISFLDLNSEELKIKTITITEDFLTNINSFFVNLGLEKNKKIINIDVTDEVFSSYEELQAEFEDIKRSIVKKYVPSLSRIIDEDNKEEILRRSFIDSVVGNTSRFDKFFDHDVYNFIHKGKVGNSKITIIGFTDFSNNSYSEEYITLGTVITNVIKNFISNIGDFDETQLFFYNANENAGLLSEKSIASSLMKKKDVESLLEKVYSGLNIDNQLDNITNKKNSSAKIITIESFLSQIINGFNNASENPSFGLRHPVEKNDVSIESKTNRLKTIYSEIKKSNEENPVFKVTYPSIHFESMNLNTGKELLKIHVYDKNNNPFYSINKILNKYYLDGFKKSGKIYRNMIKPENDYDTITSLEDDIFKELTDKKLLKKQRGIFTLGDKFENNSIKDAYKKYIPTAVFGSNNTVLTNASVTTINEAKLSTLFIVNSERNEIGKENNRIKLDIPLRVLPTQANVEMIGCPWVGFNQSIFLDFETGTTVDNLYNVTGISHTISKGSFKTSLKLAYADAYGSYEFNNNVLKKLSELKSEKVYTKKQLQTRKKSQQRLTKRTQGITDYRQNEEDLIEPGKLIQTNKTQTGIDIFNPAPNVFKNTFTKNYLNILPNESQLTFLQKVFLINNHLKLNNSLFREKSKAANFKNLLRNINEGIIIGVKKVETIPSTFVDTGISAEDNKIWKTKTSLPHLYNPKKSYLINLRSSPKEEINFKTLHTDSVLNLYNTKKFTERGPVNKELFTFDNKENDSFFEFMEITSNVEFIIEKKDFELIDIKEKQFLFATFEDINNNSPGERSTVTEIISLKKKKNTEIHFCQKYETNLTTETGLNTNLELTPKEFMIFKNADFEYTDIDLKGINIIGQGIVSKLSMNDLDKQINNFDMSTEEKEELKEISGKIFKEKLGSYFIVLKQKTKKQVFLRQFLDLNNKIRFTKAERGNNYIFYHITPLGISNYIKNVFQTDLKAKNNQRAYNDAEKRYKNSKFKYSNPGFSTNDLKYKVLQLSNPKSVMLLSEDLDPLEESEKDNVYNISLKPRLIKTKIRSSDFVPIPLINDPDGIITYHTKKAKRNSGIQSSLYKILKNTAVELDLKIEIRSGGQPPDGMKSVVINDKTYRRTGTKRHDNGYAADISIIYNNKNIVQRKYFPKENIINLKDNKPLLRKYGIDYDAVKNIENISKEERKKLRSAYRKYYNNEVKNKGITVTSEEALKLVQFVHSIFKINVQRGNFKSNLNLGVGSFYMQGGKAMLHVDIYASKPENRKKPPANYWSFGSSGAPIEPWLLYLWDNRNKKYEDLDVMN